MLKLKEPIYKKAVNYGHFGKKGMPWEEIIKNVRRKKLIALVTGASSGIGRDIARELAKRSYNLIVVARNEDALKDVKSNLEKEYNINVDIRVVDLIDREGCKKAT